MQHSIRHLIFVLLGVILMNSIGCKQNTTSYNCSESDSTAYISKYELDNSRSDFLDLFYGMERCDNHYTFKDSILDNTCGLLGYNFSDTIFYNIDNIKSRLSLGLYMDTGYPNKMIQSRIEKAVDTTLCNQLGYFDDTIRMYLFNKTYPSDSIDSLFEFWEKVFNHITATLSNDRPSSEYGVTLEARVCALAHKIYEDSVWVTYIVESTVDYHGSCGCNSNAEYLSYNKKDGTILTVQDIVKRYPDADFKDLLWSEYKQLALAKNTTPNDYFCSKSLMDCADGVAYTNNGLLFYFRPYHIGGGAEGQYNLLIQLTE